MSGIKTFYHEQIIESEKVDELVREAQEEADYQNHLAGDDICLSGQCRYCDESPEDEIEQRRRLR